VQTFNVNSLNELMTITNAGKLTVAGTTTSPATNVTINTSNAVLYADITFAATNFTMANGNNTFTAIAKDIYGRRDTNSITVNLPTTNNFAYDLNGNLLTNGTEVLVWNDENELVTNFVAGSWKSEFVYDGKMRRRIQRDYAWNGSSWTQTNETRFIYDGNVIIQHRDANNLPTLTLTRGNDLSGSLQGAGGIGGILAMTESYAINPMHSYFHADGNGNVTMLINSNQIQVAKAEYDPFGGFLSLSGSSANPYWFSSKPIHWQSGKYDFLYRWYAPSLQRWLNRDPINETGGINLYEFVYNEPVYSYDPKGLFPPSNPTCQNLKKKIENIEKAIERMKNNLDNDPLKLPENCPGDDKNPSLSRQGHRNELKKYEDNLKKKQKLYDDDCSDPEPPSRPPFRLVPIGSGPGPVQLPIPEPLPLPIEL
jgi:RHS repeat-associated protein